MSEIETNTAIPVPLPTEIPPAPDISHLPAHILHSGTIETLIGQNEDLMARLKVNVRRNGILEQQLFEQRRASDELMRANTSLSAQIEILQAKDRMLRDKVTRSEEHKLSLEEKISLLSQQATSLEERNANLQTSVRAGFRFARRVRAWVRPFIDRLQEEITELKSSSGAKDALISDLRARLSEVTLHAQSIENRYTKDQAQLVEGYEARQETLKEELSKLRIEAKLLREKSGRLDEALNAEAQSQNRVIALERQNRDLQTQLEQIRRQLHGLAAERAALDRQMETAASEAMAAREQKEKIADQFESLKAVWEETQERLESARLQNETLNRLNQELSRRLKDQREKPVPPEIGL